MGDFGLKHIYLISDLKNDFFNDLKTYDLHSSLQKLCSFNYVGTRCTYNKGGTI